jgi:hypothetical protein
MLPNWRPAGRPTSYLISRESSQVDFFQVIQRKLTFCNSAVINRRLRSTLTRGLDFAALL